MSNNIDKKARGLAQTAISQTAQNTSSIGTLNTTVSGHTSQISDITNRIPFVYNADIGLRYWRTSITKVNVDSNKILNVPVIGNSIVEGVGASNYPASTGNTDGDFSKGFVGRLRNIFNTKFEDVGFGLIPSYYPSFGTKLWSFTGTWFSNNLWGVNKGATVSNENGATATLSFNGTDVDIHIAKSNICGTFQVVIDGGAAQQFTSYQATADDAAVVSITGLSTGNHTMVITNTSTSFIILNGAVVKKGSKGVRFHMEGMNSMDSSRPINGTYDNLKAEIDVFSPELTIIAHFCNDQYFQMPIDTYKSNMQAIITRAKQYGDVLLLPVGIWQTPATPLTQKQYWDAMLQLANDNSCCMIDVFNRWGANPDIAITKLGLQADNIHPNDYGHMDIATFVASVLLETR